MYVLRVVVLQAENGLLARELIKYGSVEHAVPGRGRKQVFPEESEQAETSTSFA